MKANIIESKFEKVLYKDKMQILEALNLEFKKMKNENHSLSFWKLFQDSFDKNITTEDKFLFNLSPEILAGIIDVGIYNFYKTENIDQLLSCFRFYERLNFYYAMHNRIVDWTALESKSTLDQNLLDIAYHKPVEYDNEELDLSFALMKNGIRSIVFQNENWKKKVAKTIEENWQNLVLKFDKEVITVIYSIIIGDFTAFSKSIENALRLFPKSQWINDYYHKPQLLKYCPIFILGLYNLGFEQFKKAIFFDEFPLFDKVVGNINNATTTHLKFINFVGELGFMDDLLYNDFEKKSNETNLRIMKLWNEKK